MGQRREMGLGGYPATTLKQARDRASECRAQLWVGKDPIAERRAAIAAEKGAIAFRLAAEAYVTAHAPSWRNAKHAQQWQTSLATYAFPVFGDLPVKSIDTAHVLQALEPIWTVKTETASRVRQRIEAVLDWATARRYRTGENPARWRGHLDKLLARPSRVRTVTHFAALPYADLPKLMAELRHKEGIAARALEFCILTAAAPARSSARNGTKSRARCGPSRRSGQRRDGRTGFRCRRRYSRCLRLCRGRPRSSFPAAGRRRRCRTPPWPPFCGAWGEATSPSTAFARRSGTGRASRRTSREKVAEAALAHVLRDKVEAAYARGDLLAKRAELMAAWAAYCLTPSPKTGS